MAELRAVRGRPEEVPLGERGFAVLVLLLSMGAFWNLRVNGPLQGRDVPNSGMAGVLILWSFVYLVTIALYFWNCARPFRTLLTVSPILALVLFAFVSTLWSDDPSLTLRRSMALGLTLLFGVYFSTRFEFNEQLRLLAWAFAICIFFSFLFQLSGLNPSQGDPAWYGVFYIKNELGRAMALSALVFLFWGRIEPEHRGLARAGFWSSIVLVMLSRAMTSVVAFGLVLLLLPYLRWTLRKSLRWVAAGIVFLCAAGSGSVLYVATHMEQVTSLLGKSATLTGRVQLWILSFVMALRRPWLGYGFNAFWLRDKLYVQRIWQLLAWQPPHAHDSYLEMWLELGIIGVALFLVVSVFYIYRSMQFVREAPGPAATWPLIFLIFLMLEGLTENVFLTQNSILFILYVATAVRISGTAGALRHVVGGASRFKEQYT